MNLSQHFTLEEMTASQFAARNGIDNTPSPEALDHLRLVAMRMEDVRSRLGNQPIAVSSGFRSQRVNAAIGGTISPPSAHTLGYAVDFTCSGFGPPIEVAKFLARQADLSFDQLIYEFGSWVHISFDPRARRECLSISNRADGYVPGIVDLSEGQS